MKIVIIFPRRFFDPKQLDGLSEHELCFVEGKNIEIEQIDALKDEQEKIFVVDPNYLKNAWSGLPLESLDNIAGLRAVCLTSTAYSWVDSSALRQKGIDLTNTPGKSTNAVAEFCIFMMLSLLRKMPLVVKNDWQMDYDQMINQEAKGKKAGIVGLGQIGARVADLCEQMGMNVCYYNRSSKQNSWQSLSIEQLCSEVDVLFNSIATPPEVRNLICPDLIRSMKRSALIVATSSPVYDHELVLSQVAAGHLGGYAFESKDHKTDEYEDNVMVFPEQAYYTKETLANTARIVTSTLHSIIAGSPINLVN